MLKSESRTQWLWWQRPPGPGNVNTGGTTTYLSRVGYDITEGGAPANNRSKTQRFVALSLNIETDIQPMYRRTSLENEEGFKRIELNQKTMTNIIRDTRKLTKHENNIAWLRSAMRLHAASGKYVIGSRATQRMGSTNRCYHFSLRNKRAHWKTYPKRTKTNNMHPDDLFKIQVGEACWAGALRCFG